MREFAKFSPQFWRGSLNKKIKHCDFAAKTLAFYLMTCPNSNMIGFYYLPLSLMAHEIGTTFEVVSKALASLIDIDFCVYDEETDYVWVYEMALTQVGTALKPKDNKVKHVNALFESLPEIAFVNDFYKKYGDILQLSPSKPLPASFKASKKKEVRSEKREVISNREDLPIILGQGNKTNPTALIIPLRHKQAYEITETEIKEWQQNYPTIDVRQQIRQLIAWNQANPNRQKTQRGINRHIQGWLAHAMKSTTSSRDGPSQSTWEHNVSVITGLLEEDNGSQ